MTHPDPTDRLGELEQVMAALGTGEVDGLLVGKPGEERVLTLAGAELPYRAVLANLLDGVATLQRDGTILFANTQLAHLLGTARPHLLGQNLGDFVASGSAEQFAALVQVGVDLTDRAEIDVSSEGVITRLLVGTTAVSVGGIDVICAVLTDVTEQRRLEEQLAVERRRAAIRGDRLTMAQNVNDSIVQGIVVAETALGLGDLDRAKAALARTSRRARDLIGELVEGELTAGGAVLAAHNPAAGADS